MSTGFTVLHVDDDPEFLDLASSVLSREDRFQTVTAASANEGLERLKERRVDCLVSDSVRLPDGEPLVVAARRENPDLPILLFTAKDWSSIGDEVVDARVTEYIRKASQDDFDTLLMRLHTVADSLPGRLSLDLEAESDTESETEEVVVTSLDLGGDWQVVGMHEWDDPEEVGTSIVHAIATFVEEDPDALPPLFDRVDPDDLAGLLEPHSDGSTRQGVQVRFPYAGRELAVTSEGVVAVRSLDEADA
jgi:CheY-like chemotaxis protein